ncbi:iron-dependent repressor [Haloarcula hispanica N601]|uniref:Metal-dependent transcriptional regulator n=3 Tax=Haloarcula hispanica TaxID=51589 RepID=A0A482TDV9_HALHI|nr:MULTISPECIES: metal-dependent transcriptional regulator [Haloarcula]AEM58118.1 iron-dependent repressor [Haloarcula hispanica ATCC 33960]AHB66858.1 iron-dependent repressor [Haloarcula hispanica N601]AJF25158.1 iron-dependent repressor [Haloarcula sp. CBA1115]KAA9406222.1 metal-dependent transcriptional regulator [Haloarcula sp. CBA1131]KAA9410749.1 metal-dependent transcriptional regulator [Haloarcula hispanica]
MRTAPEYLLAIYIAQHRDDPPVAPGELGEMLDRSPAAVTEMCQRLAEDGLVSYEPYDGVTLTESGREEATELHETYVTVSWFFRGVLDLDDHETEAMELAGLVSPMVAERLAATLPCDAGAEGTRGVTDSDSTTSDGDTA